MLNLSFSQTHTYSFPEPSSSNTPPSLSPTALTCAEIGYDYYLVFLTQTVDADEFIWLNMSYDLEMGRLPTPLGRQTTAGMDYDPKTGRIICSAVTNDATLAYLIDPLTGLEIKQHDLVADTVFSSPYGAQATATDGDVFAQAGKVSEALNTATGLLEPTSMIQWRAKDGTLLGQKTYENRYFTGMTKAPFGWILTDLARHQIVIMGPTGKIIARAVGLGSPGGMHAIAYDDVRNMAEVPQLTNPPGTVGPVGTLFHPDTPWSPTPWLGRHAIYAANVIDQTIYAGFFTL